MLGVAATSVALLVLLTLSLPIVVARLPADWLLPDRRSTHEIAQPVLRVALRVLRNGIGALFVLAGIAMLVLPGQGLLTIFVGLLLVDLPGKRRLVARLLRRPTVARAVQWLRARAHQPPLLLPDEP